MIATALTLWGALARGRMALNNVGEKSPRRIEAEQRGEIVVGRPPAAARRL